MHEQQHPYFEPGEAPPPPPGHLAFPGGGVIHGEQPGTPAPEAPRVFDLGAVGQVRLPEYQQTTRRMPSGNTVTFADPETLTRGDRNDLLRVNRRLEGDPDRGLIVSGLLLAKLITAWSYPWQIPSAELAERGPDAAPAELESLNRIPIRDAQQVEKVMKEADELLFPDAPSPDQHADPTSPTGPSGE